VAVGREKVRLGEGLGGDALTGSCVTEVAEAATGAVRRPAGCGTHATTSRSTRNEAAEAIPSGGRPVALLMWDRTADGEPG
jgi:hypothetical protein